MAAPTLDRDTEATDRPAHAAPRKGPSGLLLIVPSLVFMALLFGWPMVQGVLQAFPRRRRASRWSSSSAW